MVEATKKAGVKRLVFLSVHDVEKCPEAPHFRSKIEIQKAIEASGLRWTLVMPNNFFQNDLWFRQAVMEHGVYPQPFGDVGLSRVDVRDIAEAIAAAATESGHDGQRYPLVGPDILTGTDTAAIWSRHLGREVRYGGNGLEAWALQSKAFMPEWMIEDFRIMYRLLPGEGPPGERRGPPSAGEGAQAPAAAGSTTSRRRRRRSGAADGMDSDGIIGGLFGAPARAGRGHAPRAGAARARRGPASASEAIAEADGRARRGTTTPPASTA